MGKRREKGINRHQEVGELVKDHRDPGKEVYRWKKAEYVKKKSKKLSPSAGPRACKTMVRTTTD